MSQDEKELATYRNLLAFAGIVYLLWWFAVNDLFPTAVNPLPGRMFVVLFCFSAWILSYFSSTIARHTRLLFICSTWVITGHFFYLFFKNSGSINWVVGSFITVSAISLGLLSAEALFFYSAFVATLSFLMFALLPSVHQSLLLPGLFTILLQANIALNSRLKVIKNLAASNERFQLLFNSSFEGILVHEQGEIIAVNDSLARMFGYSRGEVLGLNIANLVHPDDRKLIAIKQTLPEVAPYEVRGITKHGSYVDIEVRGKPCIYDGRPARLVTVQDLKDRKKAEQEKIAFLTMTENVRLRDEFLSIASHELKTPLSSLKLQSQLIERDIKNGKMNISPPEIFFDATRIFNRQIERLTELVEAMLDVSRISTGRLTLDKRKVDFAHRLRDILTALQIHNENGPPLPTILVEAPPQLLMIGDPIRLDQIAENLLTNAIKYGDGKDIQVYLRAEGPEALLVVQDHGLGIAPEYKEKIFDRFERAISARKISGLGLGLYITRKIVEAHGGTISVKSDLGEGSTFTVRLPLS